VECSKAGEELCAEGLDVGTKGEGSVKINAEELGSGVECKRGASQSELGLVQGLMGSALTFRGADWEVPFQRPPPKGPPDRAGSPQQVGEGRPDGKIISISVWSPEGEF